MLNVFVCVLQVSFRTSVHRQSFTVEVCVIDKNDNVPTFIGESMRGSVQLGLLRGMRTLSSDVTALRSLFQSGSHLSVLLCGIQKVLPKQWKTCLMYPWKLQFTLNLSIKRINDVANWVSYIFITLKGLFCKLSQGTNHHIGSDTIPQMYFIRIN